MMIVRRGLAALAALATVLGTVSCGVGAQPTRLTAQFRDSVGIYQGNDVAVLGIKVGRVARVTPAGRFVEVELEVNPDVKIPADAMAVTLSPSVVTDRRVELTPVYRGGPTLRDGAVIPLERTRTPVEIDRVFEAADRLSGELVRDKEARAALSGAVATGADIVRGRGDQFNRVVKGTANTVGVFADNRDQLMNLIRNGEHLTAVAARNDQVIRSVTGNLAAATELFDQQGDNFVKIMNNLTDVLDRTEELIEKHRPEMADSVDNLRVTVGTLADRRRELRETLDLLPLTLQNIVGAIDPGQKAVRAHISIFQPILDTQLLQGLCARYKVPVFCAAPGGALGGDQVMAGLAGLFLGGGTR